MTCHYGRHHEAMKPRKQTNTLPKPLFNRVASMLKAQVQEPDPCLVQDCLDRGSGKTCIVTYDLPSSGHHWKLVTCKDRGKPANVGGEGKKGKGEPYPVNTGMIAPYKGNKARGGTPTAPPRKGE